MKKILFIITLIVLPFLGNAESYLKKGDIIDIIAPSYGCKKAELDKIKAHITALGYRPRVSDGLNNPTYLSYANSYSYRLNDLRRALAATDSKVVWIVRGGYGAQELLEDIQEFSKPTTPKILVGYSDATHLHLYLNQVWDMPSLHGIGLKFNQDINPHVNEAESLASVTNFLESPSFSYPITPLNHVDFDPIASKIIGGNLSVVVANMGTFNEIQTKDKILLLEDIGESPQRTQRNLMTLKLAGKLDDVHAIIFGDFTKTNDRLTSRTLKEFADTLAVPCFKTELFGHGTQNKPLMLNSPLMLEMEGDQAVLKSNE